MGNKYQQGKTPWMSINLMLSLISIKANESSKIQGIFMDAAKERFQQTQTNPDFDKQLSMVSIVGARGVGKSTIASLLSGNHSMFTVGSGSVGTTTTGADISTIIPSTDYAETMGSKLGHVLNKVTEYQEIDFFLSI